jgi:hypothetical protein
MKSFYIALLLAFTTSLLIFAVLVTVLDAAYIPAIAPLSTAPLASVTPIAEALERRWARESLASHRPSAIATIDEFAIPWPLVVAYGSVAIMALMHISSAIAGGYAGLAVGFLNQDQNLDLSPIVIVRLGALYNTFLGTLILMIGSFFFGRWVGRRCRSKGVLSIILMVLGASGMSLAISMALRDVLFDESTAEAMYDVINFSFGAVKSILVLFATLIGYGWGRRQRVAKYMAYLLRVLPLETRVALIDLAYEEAKRVGATKRVATQPPMQAHSS